MPTPAGPPSDLELAAIGAQFGLDTRDRLDLWRERWVADQPLIEVVRSVDLDGRPSPPPRRRASPNTSTPIKRKTSTPSWALGESETVATRVDAALEVIDRTAELCAFTSTWPNEARAAAQALDARARRGERMGVLYGAVVAVKDIMDVRGHVMSAGTRAFRSTLAVDDATVVGRLRTADAVVIGMTNLHALAYGPFSSSNDLGPVRNPLQPGVVAGGSSGGSAAAVAVGAVHVAIGTDTAGSVRMPAALCGVVGFKGGYGAASVHGVQPLAPSLDHVGPLARTVRDVTTAWEVMADEPLTVAAPDRESLEGVVIGDLRHYVRDYLDHEVRESLESALEAVRRLGASVEPVTIPDLDRAPGAMLCTIGPEALDAHRELLARRADLLPEDVRLRLEAGAFVTAGDYLRAGRLRCRLRAQLSAVFTTVDVVLLPSLPITAPLLDALDAPVAHGRWTTRSVMSRFTVLANLTGHPAITIPWAHDERGAGIGIQLVGSLRREGELLGVAGALERGRMP